MKDEVFFMSYTEGEGGGKRRGGCGADLRVGARSVRPPTLSPEAPELLGETMLFDGLKIDIWKKPFPLEDGSVTNCDGP